MRPLTPTAYGFSVIEDNPFAVFRFLQKVARDSVGAAHVVDLSRGDPGYHFTSSARARRFFSYLVFLDTVLNTPRKRFSEWKTEQFDTLWRHIVQETNAAYSPDLAKEFLDTWEELFTTIGELAQAQKLNYTRFDVLANFFKCGTVSGGCYGDPQGEEMARAVVAWWHQKIIKTPIDFSDLIFTNGASHAIGTTFKLLGQEGIGYLTAGDKVVIASPVYSPYNSILKHRGIEVLSFSVDPFTGNIAEDSLAHLAEYKGPIKALLLIDPNNPTGFSMQESVLQKLCTFARAKNCLIITDEVYAAFFSTKKTMVDLCPERVIRISSRSKIERATGLRFGDALITKEGNRYLTEKLLKVYLKSGRDFKAAFMAAKGPGGITGDLQHTTFVPPPMQYLGVLHILLGQKERQAYREAVSSNRDIFYTVLKLPHRGNLYYVIFDLNTLAGPKKKKVPIEEKLIALAKLGVVYIPAYQFFSEADRETRDCTHMVRASIVNTTPKNIQRAAEITKEYLVVSRAEHK